MRTRPLRMRRITWFVCRGSKNNYIFGIPDPDSLCNFGGSTMKIIKVICENNGIPDPDLPIHYATSVAHWLRERSLYWIRSLIFSQWRDLRKGETWENLGALKQHEQESSESVGVALVGNRQDCKKDDRPTFLTGPYCVHRNSNISRPITSYNFCMCQ